MILHVFQNHVYQKIKINTYFTLQVILSYIKFALSSPKMEHYTMVYKKFIAGINNFVICITTLLNWMILNIYLYSLRKMVRQKLLWLNGQKLWMILFEISSSEWIWTRLWNASRLNGIFLCYILKQYFVKKNTAQ